MTILLRLWRPASIQANSIPLPPGAEGNAQARISPRLSPAKIVMAWSPFLFAAILIFVGGLPRVHDALTFKVLQRPVPFLHNSVLRMPPLAAAPSPEPAIADLNIAAMNGTAIFLGATLAALALGLSFRDVARILKMTLVRLKQPLLGVSLMVGFAFVTRYSGIISTMTLGFTKTGAFYPFFAAFVGWMGVALTGTDSGSNGLFGFLQKSTAERLGLDPLLMAAANPSGGAMGKLMDASSILVSATATQQAGREGEIFKTVFRHSVMLTAIVGLILLALSYF
jgi:lactate permease